MSKFLIYVGHSIRGMKGDDATAEDMRINNENAIKFTTTLRDLFPNADFYVPAEMDTLLITHEINPGCMVKQLLALDCAIINSRDLLLVWIPDQYVSNGMMVELLYASQISREIAIVRTVEEAEIVLNIALKRKMR